MGIFDKFKKKKEVKRPNLIVFEKENVDNDYANFELKIKPRISTDDGFPQEAYQRLAERRKEMLEQIEEIILRNYLDETSEDLSSEVGSFPDIRYFTGNYLLCTRVTVSLTGIIIIVLTISKTDNIEM